MSLMSFLCCQVGVSASGSLTDCGVSNSMIVKPR
jgi:hypothetical protein